MENGGKQDCFYIAAAKGCAENQAVPKPTTEKDWEPKGSMQAAVRLLAAKIGQQRKFQASTEAAERVGTSGKPADSLAVRLTAEGCRTDIYVRVKLKGEHTWTLYGREAGAKPRRKEMWLALENQHYRYLKGKEGIKGSDEWEKTLA